MQLSSECRDLLDRIFVIEEKKRISIQEMKKHPWYNKPLPARLQHAECHLLEEQQRWEAHIANRQLEHVITSYVAGPPHCVLLLLITLFHCVIEVLVLLLFLM